MAGWDKSQRSFAILCDFNATRLLLPGCVPGRGVGCRESQDERREQLCDSLHLYTRGGEGAAAAAARVAWRFWEQKKPPSSDGGFLARRSYLEEDCKM